MFSLGQRGWTKKLIKTAKNSIICRKWCKSAYCTNRRQPNNNIIPASIEFTNLCSYKSETVQSFFSPQDTTFAVDTAALRSTGQVRGISRKGEWANWYIKGFTSKKTLPNHHSFCLTKQLNHTCNTYKCDRLYSTVQTFMSCLRVHVTVELYCNISELTVEYKISH